MLTEGEEMTHKETQGTHRTRRKRRRQTRKVRGEWKTRTQEGSEPAPASGGWLRAGGSLKAQAGPGEGDGTQEGSHPQGQG